jgi:S1-C subfamily serine protease
MKITHKITLLTVAVGLLAGCVSASTMMVNQEGKWVRCSATGAGWLGAPIAAVNHSRCIEDLQKIGYAPLPNADWGVKVSEWSSSPAKITGITAGSPADVAGIKLGDIIRAIDNQPVDKGLDVIKLVADKNAGDLLRVQVERSGTILEITSVLQVRK